MEIQEYKNILKKLKMYDKFLFNFETYKTGRNRFDDIDVDKLINIYKSDMLFHAFAWTDSLEGEDIGQGCILSLKKCVVKKYSYVMEKYFKLKQNESIFCIQIQKKCYYR